MNSEFVYKYEELEPEGHWSRLLTLLPGRRDDPIEISLDATRLDIASPPDYEAISYAWGSTIPPAHVLVLPRRAPLRVTANLHSALVHLRLATAPRTLWADAVCINQSSLAERSRQVSRMGHVFATARHVIVWLGQASPNSDLAMDALAELSAQIEEYDWILGRLRMRDPDRPLVLPWRPGGSCEGQDARAAIVDLLERSWFERLWVRQEIGLARDAVVHCGDCVLPWGAISHAVGGLDKLRELEGIPGYEAPMALLARLCMSPTLYLSELRHRLADALCSDPRDKIYGILPLLNENASRLGITPDYTRSVSQVYEGVVVRYFETLHSLDILRECELAWDGRSVLTNLPSWVPDFSTEQASLPNFGPTLAGSNIAPVIDYRGKGVLRLGGVKAAGISAVVHVAELKAVNLENVGRLDHLADAEMRIRQLWSITLASYNDTCIAYRGVDGLLDAFCDALVCGEFDGSMVASALRHPSWERSRETLCRVLKMSWGEWQGYIALVVPERSDHWIHYLVRARWRWSRQSFFLTESGHIGLGPLGVLAGDIVSVFLGYYSTTVIRQVKEVEGPVVDGGAGSVPKHRIVGNSYVPGLNAGEAIFRRAENHETHTLVYIQEPRGGFNIYFRNPRTQIPQRSDPKLEKFFANPTLTRYPLDISESDPEFSALVNYWYPVSIQDLQRRGLQVGHITLI